MKNDALINLADNLKTKGLPPRYFAPSIPTPFAPLSRIKIQDAKLPINEGWATAEAKASTGRWRTDSQRTRRVITLKNYPSSEFHRSVSTRSLHRVSSSFHSFLISSVCANSQELMKRKNETLERENKNMTIEQFNSVRYGGTLKKRRISTPRCDVQKLSGLKSITEIKIYRTIFCLLFVIRLERVQWYYFWFIWNVKVEVIVLNRLYNFLFARFNLFLTYFLLFLQLIPSLNVLFYI